MTAKLAETSGHNKLGCWPYFWFALVILLWVLNLCVPSFIYHLDRFSSIRDSYSQTNMNRTGTFGDTFGAANSLFSGLAFAGVAVAIMFQRRELTKAHEESKTADEERRRTEKYAFLTASLNAATSLANSYSDTITLTRSTTDNSRASSISEHGAPIPARGNVVIERQFLKYRQLQQMIFFEIQNVDLFYHATAVIPEPANKKGVFRNLYQNDASGMDSAFGETSASRC